MRKMPQRGRVTKFGEPLNQRVVVNFTATQVEQLNTAINGGDMGAFIRDATLQALSGEPQAQAENRVTFDVSPDSRAALQRLADGLHVGDVDVVARMVALRLAAMPIDDAKAVLLGDIKNALQSKLAPDLQAKKAELLAQAGEPEYALAATPAPPKAKAGAKKNKTDSSKLAA